MSLKLCVLQYITVYYSISQYIILHRCIRHCMQCKISHYNNSWEGNAHIITLNCDIHVFSLKLTCTDPHIDYI